MSNSARFDFKFYEWEKKFHDRPFLRQPFGDQWEEYTWAEVGQMARKLANGLKSMGLKDDAHIGLISKIAENERYGHHDGRLCFRSFFSLKRRVKKFTRFW